MQLLTTIVSVLFPLACAKRITIYDSDLPELQYINPEIDPCDDFYEFACGNFKSVLPKPPEEQVQDIFTLVEDHVLQIGKNILSTPRHESDPEALKKAKSAYHACLDTDFADTINVPETKIIEEVGGFPLISPDNSSNLSWADIGHIVGRYGVPLFFHFSINQFDMSKYIILMTRDDGKEEPSIRANHRRTYDHFIEDSFIKAAQDYNPGQFSTKSDPFFNFIEKVASNILSSSAMHKPEEDLHKDLCSVMTFAKRLYSAAGSRPAVGNLPTAPTIRQLQNWTVEQFGSDSGMNWLDYVGAIFQRAGVEVSEDTEIFSIVAEQEIHRILKLVSETDPHVVKNFVLLRNFLFLSPDSDKVTREAFEEYCKAKDIPLYSRSDYCARKILDVIDVISLSVAVTYDYQRYYFNVNKIPQVGKLIGDIRSVYNTTFLRSDWLDLKSRGIASAKLSQMLVLLGYPEFAQEQDQLDGFYENVEICLWDNYGNAQKLRAFQRAFHLTKYATKNRNYWDHSPFTVGAFYNIANNKIIVPVAMLNSTFYQLDNPLVEYSRLGFIVAHEMTHAFDKSIISADDANALAQFVEKNNCFRRQYDEYYIPEIELYVDGTRSLNENLSDNAGILQSYKAFRKFIKSNKVKNQSKKFTSDQLFFLGFATTFCSQETPKYLHNLVTATSYSPARYRVTGPLSNSKQFSKAFKCPAGSRMNPKNKCKLW